MTRRSLSLAAVLGAAAATAYSADEPAEPVHLYMLPPVIRPTPQELPRVVRRDPVEAFRPAPAVTIQMEPVGAFNISCALQITQYAPASNAMTVAREPVVAPKPVPEPVSVTGGIDPSIFSCSIRPATGGEFEAAETVAAGR